MTGAWGRARQAAAGVGRTTANAGRGAFRAGRAIVRGTRSAGRGVGHATRRMTHAQGAGRSGLGGLIELSAAHSAGDAFVTVALAGTLFFGMPTGEARGQVALYLLITMAPFAVVAPFVGPVLDRFRSGRRYVMAGTMFARGLLCWAMAAAIPAQDTLTLFPAALAVLVLSKAYNVSRAAIMPSVLPSTITLVTANARVSLFALVAAGAAAPLSAGVTAWLGAEWTLRGTMVLFLVGGVGALRLPRHVDSPDDLSDESPADAPADPLGGPGRLPRRRRARALRWLSLLNLGPVLNEAMYANTATRIQSGFLIFYLLFLVRAGDVPGLPIEVTIAVLAAAAGAGGLLGSAVASWIRSRAPRVIVLATLALATVTSIAGAVLFGLWMAVVVAGVAAFAQSLGKLALDAMVQHDVAEDVRSATFGVVEALLQIAWVLGGLAGLLLSLFAKGPAGLGIVGAGLALTLVWLLAGSRRRSRARARRARPAPAPDAADDPADVSSGDDSAPVPDPADPADPAGTAGDAPEPGGPTRLVRGEDLPDPPGEDGVITGRPSAATDHRAIGTPPADAAERANRPGHTKPYETMPHDERPRRRRPRETRPAEEPYDQRRDRPGPTTPLESPY